MYGAFHLACYDADSGTYQMICKIGTGFSEDALKTHWDTLKPCVVAFLLSSLRRSLRQTLIKRAVLRRRLELAQKKAYYDVGGAKGPDVYFEPKVVRPALSHCSPLSLLDERVLTGRTHRDAGLGGARRRPVALAHLLGRQGSVLLSAAPSVCHVPPSIPG